jgi:hypothetical protein
MRWQKIVYWIATGMLSALMLFAAGNYIFKHELIVEVFSNLGFPAFIIYPLAVAKLLGVVAIVSRRSPTLTEWAYAGFFFNFMLAFSAHINVGDGQFLPAALCLVLLIVSYTIGRKIYKRVAL